VNIGVILVDDHAVVRDGLRHLIEAQADLKVLAGFGDGREAVSFAVAEHPDVAVVDVAMPGMNGIEVARQIHDACPASHVLMLSMHAELEYIYQAMRAGADGYLIKESAGSELVDAVRALHAGRRYFSRKLDGSAIERYARERERGERNPLERLSSRERQVMQLIVEGMTSAEVAERLRLSPKSVETYRSRLMGKLQIEDMPGLVKFAIRSGVTSTQ
jgi:DNA-binding NarL/FixJ family response regulator